MMALASAVLGTKRIIQIWIYLVKQFLAYLDVYILIVITPMFSISYEILGAYNPRVEDFGGRLGWVIDARKLDHVEIARVALGVTASPKALQAFANYISRLRTSKVPNPGLMVLERLAKGMRLTLSEFFLQIERQTESLLPPGINSAKKEDIPHRAAPNSVEVGDEYPNFSAALLGNDYRLLEEISRAFARRAQQLRKAQKARRAHLRKS